LLAFKRPGDRRFDPLVLDRARRASPRVVAQTFDTLHQKAATPLVHGHGMHVEQTGNCLVLQPIGASQNDPRALRQCLSVFGREAIAVRSNFSASASVSTSNCRPAMPALPLRRRKARKSRRIVRNADYESLI
jgi:hypothetical protein